MRRLLRALPCLLLALCLGEIRVDAVCSSECSSINDVQISATEIQIQLPSNFIISNVTFANGTEVKIPLGNSSISGLDSGIEYIIYFTNSTDTCCRSITTKPSPVFDLHIANTTNTTIALKWNNNDSNASSYMYQVQIEGDIPTRMTSSNTTSIVFKNLKPGTSYTFKIYPVAADNKTFGDLEEIIVFTKPNPVSYLHVENISTTTVTLKWNNSDPNASNYTYQIQIEGNGTSRNESSNTTSIVVWNLEPGTPYTFRIYPVVSDNNTVGDLEETTIYTRPNPVSDIHFDNISSTAVNLIWKNGDLHASNYTYLVQVQGNGNAWNESFDTTTAVIQNLKPGIFYTFKIYPVAGDKTVGEPSNITANTKPSPVFDIYTENVRTNSVTLKWNNSDPDASNYTYRIKIEGNGTSKNEFSTTSSLLISSLEPGTLYKLIIYPVAADNSTVGDPNDTTVYTKPDPVSDIFIESFSSTAVNLTWKNNDLHASNYTYRIEVKGNGTSKDKFSDTTSKEISSLEPGTSYTFNIYPIAPDNKTSGELNNVTIYTRPSPVSNIYVESISTTTVNLTWTNSDLHAPNYTYRIQIEGNYSVGNEFFDTTNAVINNLEPGTSYIFDIYSVAADNKTEGNPNNATTYTMPSSVSNINVTDVSTTVVNLTWKNADMASLQYSYRIHITGGTDENMTFQTSNAEISKLSPGTNYTFSIFSVAGNGKTEGSPSSINYCTNPAPVDELVCKPVTKQPELILNWTPPNGTYEGFRIEVLNNIWMETLNREYQTSVKSLNYFTNYTVTIITRSCGKESSPTEIRCLTSITDPPVPSDPPAILGTSHSSLKVQFDSFDSSHGPVTAYAIIVTTADVVSNESLQYTYDDFVQKKTSSYVASVISVKQKRSSSSSINPDYDIDIGDGSTAYGYVNGKLDPLGSYRACVAGFTHIAFLNKTVELINREESYVSFTPISGPVVLPQNPGVVIGAVVGCVLAAIVIAAVVGFIFWTKRRNGGKNTEVPIGSFEPKKSKLIKVENFEPYFKKQKADSNCGFAEEYEDLRLVGVNQPKFAAELPDNKGKNRYNNVLPYDISRVKLSIQTQPGSDYINANYMPGYNSKKEFIAAQGPLPTTVQDFWRMIWEKNIYTVVMLTKCVEQGRTKCEEYWPNKQSKSYGDITVAMTSEIVLPEWTIRDFSVEKSDSSESHPVRQFHFTAWPDHGVPETTDLLISFRHLVQEYMKQNPSTSPTLVHCSAGVGRTGTFIAIDRLIHQMEMENTVDVYGVVYDLRMHRSLMVQTEDQYVFLNQCVLDIIKSKKERKTDLIYQNTNAMAIYENVTPSPHTGKANGYHV
ncbi:receptor-type tyrosine-protein phosphatase eta isoform X2 [Sceloporus undulatus]|uniref:receptor-type tyrosine-protein phosphatase eta isoform X2 n=1 Tax=Sceloporus undulatus TaxID=8520 RepID=UPI001C4CA29E|nr:receptor-type tyrosine-protein phosphatase eta isoform X2 [Sceloporus undulatus]